RRAVPPTHRRPGEHRRAGCPVGAGSAAVRLGIAGRDRDRHRQGHRGHHVHRDADLVGRSAEGGGMTLAIARLEAVWAARQAPGQPASGGSQYGTAFAISPTLALTAFHCIGELDTGVVRTRRVRLRFRGGMVEAAVEGGDPGADYAVLRLLAALPPQEQPIRLVADCQTHERWYSIGFPAAVPDVDGYAVAGT